MAGNNALVVFFSRTGNTRTVARFIQEKLCCKSFEVKAADPYPKDYNATVKRARRELDNDFRPELTEDLDNIDSFETVFIGYPCWCGTMPMALFTFLEAHDLSGKNIAPFCTHEGSGLGYSVKDISVLCPQSNVLEALTVRGSVADRSVEEVQEWLKRTGMSERKA